MPIRNIKHHGSLTLDCVWTYIQENKKSTRAIALAFAYVVDMLSLLLGFESLYINVNM